MNNNTIFDNVFRTMVEKMPTLVIPVLNEVFGTHYQYDERFEQLRNEHQLPSGEIITDSCIKIGNRLYHMNYPSHAVQQLLWKGFLTTVTVSCFQPASWLSVPPGRIHAHPYPFDGNTFTGLTGGTRPPLVLLKSQNLQSASRYPETLFSGCLRPRYSLH